MPAERIEISGPELHPTIELALSSHPVLGNSSYIREVMYLSFVRRLNAIGEEMGSARALADRLGAAPAEIGQRLVGDTVLRSAIKCAHTTIVARETQPIPLGICSRIFDMATSHLGDGGEGFLIQRHRRPMPVISDGPDQPAIWQRLEPCDWIWNDDPEIDAYDRLLNYIVGFHGLGPLSNAEDADIDNLRCGSEILQRLLPELTRSAYSHVQSIVCFEPIGRNRNVASCSQYRLPGMTFLNRNTVKNPWAAAEHLLHECLHHKLYDFRLGHRLLSETFEETNEARVCSLWNSPGNNRANMWNTHRAMAAFHVYAHLALFAKVAEDFTNLSTTFGPRRGVVSSRDALDRAHYLGWQIKLTCGDELGPAGSYMVDWLSAVLDTLDDRPNRKTARSHLLLQRYVREARRVEVLQSDRGTRESDLTRELDRMAAFERYSYGTIMSSIGYDSSVSGNPADRPNGTGEVSTFAAVRLSIAERLSDRFDSDDGEALHAMDRDGRFIDQVESGSAKLQFLIERSSPTIVEGKILAHRRGFRKSCRDDVGRFLSMLAAAVPLEGRVLEIGTGAGVGLGWIVKGLEGRNDVRVVSVESDVELAEAVRSRVWPHYVQVVNDDGRSLLSGFAEFDLIFADASPMKSTETARIVALLNPRGQLLIDDVALSGDEQPGDRMRDELRSYLETHPELETVFIDSETGMLLSTRRSGS